MSKEMERIISILAERDGLTRAEAESVVQEAKDLMKDCSYDPAECEDIMYEMLGLEMDYIFDVLWG